MSKIQEPTPTELARTLERVVAEGARYRDAELTRAHAHYTDRMKALEADLEAKASAAARDLARIQEAAWRSFESRQDAHLSFLDGRDKRLVAASFGLGRAYLDDTFGRPKRALFAGKAERAGPLVSPRPSKPNA